jgi:phage gp36-like protein
MAYTTQARLAALVAAEQMVRALDDDGDGVADAGAWEAVEAAAASQVDGRLGQRYGTPVAAPLPALVQEAADVFVAEILYLRRGLAGDANPWTARADAMRARLERIGRGEEPLTATAPSARPSVSAITEPARTVRAGGGDIP